MEPTNLTELLGVTPFFHLVPKRDIAPLVSISGIKPKALDPREFLSTQGQEMFHTLEDELEQGSEAAHAMVKRMQAKFQDFDDSELDSVTFERPVFAADNDEQPELPEISKLYNGLYSSKDCIGKKDLVEFGDDLDLPDYSDYRIDLLDGSESQEEVIKHMRSYKERYERELHDAKPERKKARLNTSVISRISRRKIKLDRSKLRDSALAALYDFVDNAISAADSTRDMSDPELDPHANLSSDRSKVVIMTQDYGLILTPLGTRYLDEHLSKVAESSSLADCHLDYLKEIQTLCYNTVRESKAMPTALKIETVTNSVKSCSILLEIINANPLSRELHLQSYIDCVIEYLAKILPDTISANSLSPVIAHIIECVEKLCQQLISNVADDHTLTQVEYLCVRMIYVVDKVKEVEQLKATFLGVLRQIFKHYPSQQSFIMNEMLSNLNKFAHQKALVRDVTLPHGVNVSFFSTFLVDLVQSFDTSSLQEEVSSLLALPKSNNSSGPANVKRCLILENTQAIYDGACSVGIQAAEFFIGRLSVVDSVHKSIFSGIMEDLFTIMSDVEWPGAETAASVIVSYLISAMNAQKVSSADEPFILDIIGKFGLETLDLILKCPYNFDSDEKASFEGMTECFSFQQSVLHYLRSSASNMTHRKPLLQFQLLKTIVFYKSLYDKSVSVQNRSFVIMGNDSNHLSETATKIIEKLDMCLSFVTKTTGFDQASQDLANPKKSYKISALASTLHIVYNDFLALLTICLESTKVKLAAKAIRVLSPLVVKNPSILLHKRINSSISRILSKGSALSKEAVIDLLGQYMFSSTELVKKYHVLIGDQSNDLGVSVRKRVMRIMMDVFDTGQDSEMMGFACCRVLERIEDEEKSIVELAKKLLRVMLFDNKYTKQAVDVMLYMTNAESRIRLLFVGFLRQEFCAAQGSQYKASLQNIINHAFDEMVGMAESLPEERTSQAFNFVAALAECDSHLITQDHLISLQPFLIKDDFDNDALCLGALRILRLVVPNAKALRAEYVSKTNSILLKRLTKFSFKELQEAVQVINVFSQLSNNLPLTKAAISSMKILWPFVFQTGKKPSSDDLLRIRKVMYLLGCFGSHCNFENLRETFLGSNLGLREKESILSLMTRYLLYFCHSGTELITRVAGLKNLLAISVHHPRLLLSETILRVLDSELNSSTLATKIEIVRGLTELLRKEDVTQSKTNEESSTTKSISGLSSEFSMTPSSNAIDGVCSSIVQRYFSTVLELCVHDASEMGSVSVDFLQAVTKLGYANPKTCISTIIALEASPRKQIKRIATELHTEIFEKHESLADRNYVEATRMACEYVKRTEPSGHTRNHSFLRSVYRIINTNYSAKKKFINSIGKLFQLKMATDDLTVAVSQRDVAIFSVLNLSVLDFTSMEEVYLMMFHLDRFIRGDGMDLAERITGTVGSAAGEGMSISNLQLLFVFSQTALAFIHLKKNLAASYSIRPAMMDGFRPSKPDVELRQPPKIVNIVDYPVAELSLQTKLSSPGAFGALFTQLVQLVNAYTS